MEKKVASGIMLTLLFIFMLTFASSIQPVRAEPATWYVNDDGGADFTKIQDAINVASPGDTVYVYNGTYYEHLYIGKENLTVIAESNTDTIVDGSGSGAVVNIWVDRVTISRFTVRNSGWGYYFDMGSGIYLERGKKFCNITKNIITNSRYGLGLWRPINSTITRNYISNTDQAISFDEGKYNTVTENSISDSELGIGFWYTYQNTIENNTIFNAIWGIYSSDSESNTISHNMVTYNAGGIELGARAFDNIITSNTLANNDYGIWLDSSSGNSISENNITANSWVGMRLYDSSRNSISENNIANNDYGILLSFSSDNRFYHNSFVNNTQQVDLYESINVWDDGYPSGGNYWSDYAGVDEKSGPDQDQPGSDGIGDSAYVVDADNRDNYPLVEPWTPLPTTIRELKTKIEELGSVGEIDNQGIVKSLIAKLNTAQNLIDKGNIDDAKSILADDFIPQVQNLSGIHITPEAADILIESAEYMIAHL